MVLQNYSYTCSVLKARRTNFKSELLVVDGEYLFQFKITLTLAIGLAVVTVRWKRINNDWRINYVKNAAEEYASVTWNHYVQHAFQRVPADLPRNWWKIQPQVIFYDFRNWKTFYFCTVILRFLKFSFVFSTYFSHLNEAW